MPFLFNIMQEILAMAVKQEKEINDIQIGKKEVKLFLFANNLVLYIEGLPRWC